MAFCSIPILPTPLKSPTLTCMCMHTHTHTYRYGPMYSIHLRRKTPSILHEDLSSGLFCCKILLIFTALAFFPIFPASSHLKLISCSATILYISVTFFLPGCCLHYLLTFIIPYLNGYHKSQALLATAPSSFSILPTIIRFFFLYQSFDHFIPLLKNHP